MTPEQEQQLNMLLQWKRQMESSNTIPLNIDQAFRGRFPVGTSITTSTKAAGSENQVVEEAGAATYSVLKPPDAFYQFVDSTGVVIYIPIYT